MILARYETQQVWLEVRRDATGWRVEWTARTPPFAGASQHYEALDLALTRFHSLVAKWNPVTALRFQDEGAAA